MKVRLDEQETRTEFAALERGHAVLMERANTKHAECRTDITRLAEVVAELEAEAARNPSSADGRRETGYCRGGASLARRGASADGLRSSAGRDAGTAESGRRIAACTLASFS